jgi:hypothetical protein
LLQPWVPAPEAVPLGVALPEAVLGVVLTPLLHAANAKTSTKHNITANNLLNFISFPPTIKIFKIIVRHAFS